MNDPDTQTQNTKQNAKPALKNINTSATLDKSNNECSSKNETIANYNNTEDSKISIYVAKLQNNKYYVGAYKMPGDLSKLTLVDSKIAWIQENNFI